MPIVKYFFFETIGIGSNILSIADGPLPAGPAGERVRRLDHKKKSTAGGPLPACPASERVRRLTCPGPSRALSSHRTPSPAGRAGRGRGESAGSSLSHRTASPAGQAGRGL